MLGSSANRASLGGNSENHFIATDERLGIAKRIQQVSNEILQVQQGSLYPALHRLEHHGWIKAEWRESENNRKAKYYSLTAAGRKQLRAELAQWERLSGRSDWLSIWRKAGRS